MKSKKFLRNALIDLVLVIRDGGSVMKVGSCYNKKSCLKDGDCEWYDNNWSMHNSWLANFETKVNFGLQIVFHSGRKQIQIRKTRKILFLVVRLNETSVPAILSEEQSWALFIFLCDLYCGHFNFQLHIFTILKCVLFPLFFDAVFMKKKFCSLLLSFRSIWSQYCLLLPFLLTNFNVKNKSIYPSSCCLL